MKLATISSKRVLNSLSQHQIRYLVVVLTLAAVTLTLHAGVRPLEDTGPDGNVYEENGAQAAASNHLLGCGNFNRAYWSPGWIATVALVYRVVGREPMAVRVVLIVIALATGWLLFSMARRLAGPCAGIVAACLFLFSSLVFRFTAYYQYEIPFAFLTALAGYVLFFVGAPVPYRSNARTVTRILAAGVLVAMAALMSPRVMALFPLAVACFWIRSGWRSAIRTLAVLLVGVWLVLLPWGLRNHHCFGKWIFTTTNGGINLYMGNNAYNDGTGFYLPPEGVRPSHAFDDSGAWLREAAEHIAQHPGRTVVLALTKGLQFWNPHYGDQALVLVLFVAGWVRLRRSRQPISPGLLWVLGAPFVFMAVHMVFYVQVRYMIPALPMVTVVAGAGLCGWRVREGAATEIASRERA
jgi:4-amino-4-deoxy-L-arabinose transferase-like glycosyltransferase